MITSMEKKTDLQVVIADSSGLVSLISPNDSNHQQALALSHKLQEKRTTVLTPSNVFTETVNILGKKLGHQIAVEAAELMTSSELFLVVDTLDAYPLALEKFKAAPASVSFTDCVVMATADKYQTSEVFGFDECFEKGSYHLPK
jgi:predicted nucleic acid-binding protein